MYGIEKRVCPGRVFLVPLRSLVYSDPVPTTTLLIDGMSCDHCVQSLTEALERLPGVRKAQVSLEFHNAVVQHGETGPSVKDMVKAIEDEGYGASGA